MTIEEQVDGVVNRIIDPSEVVNGSIWQARWPQCWTILVQWIDFDQWVLLGIGGRPYLEPSVAFDRDRIVILTQEQAAQRLRKFRATRMENARLILVDMADHEREAQKANELHDILNKLAKLINR